MSGSAPSDAFFCYNPNCVRGAVQKAFATESAFEKHLAMCPPCRSYLQRHFARHAVPPPRRASVGIVVAPSGVVKEAGMPDGSKKRKCVRRRDVVNDINPQFLLDAAHVIIQDHAAVKPPVLSGEEYAYDSDAFADNGNGWEDGCIVEEVPSVSLKDHKYMHMKDQKWTVDLLKILDNMNAPDYAYGDILSWARDASADNFTFNPPGGLSRSRSVDLLFQSIPNAHELLPSVISVDDVDAPEADKVVVFDFVPQLLRLLQSSDIMIQDNLVIDLECPLKPYVSPDGRLGEALSGQVYADAYNRYITCPHKQLFVPIIQWIDRTVVSGNDRFTLKPYMFTPAIFTESFRRKFQAWGFHGFLPKVKLSSAERKVLKRGDPVRGYHKQLRRVLDTFRTADDRLRDVKLPIGPTGSMTVDIVTCILFVIQDMEEGDNLCGRYAIHTSGCQRPHRACTVTYAKLDSHLATCDYLSADFINFIANSDDETVRQRWSQHSMDNAFNSVRLADPERGICGATPAETMHCVRMGMINLTTLLVLSNVPASKKAALDRLAIKFHKGHRQTYRKMFPTTDFSKGITNLTKISAAERIGLVFLFVILFQYEEGWSILDSCLISRGSTLRAVLELFESMLCFDAWLNQATYWKLEDTAEAKASFLASLRQLMQWCTTRIPRGDQGQKWNFPKFHELLHVVDDMIRFGASGNFCAQRPESLLKDAAKKPGRRAQKRHAGVNFELQSAQRLAQSFVIDTVHSRIWQSPGTADAGDPPADATATVVENSGKGTWGVITRVSLPTHPVTYHYPPIAWTSSTDHSRLIYPSALLHFICEEFGDTVRICTEFRRDVHTFRCHPHFQSDGPIFDWMLVDFEGYTDQYPCRLAAVVANDAFDPTVPGSSQFWLVVQSTKARLLNKSSALLSEWTWSPAYCVIETSAVIAPCFVISIDDDDSKVLETKAPHLWAAEFTHIF